MIAGLRITTEWPQRRCFLVSSVEPNLVTVEAMRFLTPSEAKQETRRFPQPREP